MLEEIKVLKVACGSNHTCFISFEYQLFSMGDNSYGQLGIGPNITQTVTPQKVFFFLISLSFNQYSHLMYKIIDRCVEEKILFQYFVI